MIEYVHFEPEASPKSKVREYRLIEIHGEVREHLVRASGVNVARNALVRDGKVAIGQLVVVVPSKYKLSKTTKARSNKLSTEEKIIRLKNQLRKLEEGN